MPAKKTAKKTTKTPTRKTSRSTKAETTEFRKKGAEDVDRKPPKFFPLGTPGLRRSGSRITYEWLKELQGPKGAKMYREMGDNHTIIGAALWVIELIIRQTQWSIEPAADTPEAREKAVFGKQCIDDMQGGMTGFTTEFLTALQYGWAWMEKTYKLRKGPEFTLPQLRSKHTDGRVGIYRIGLIGQESLHEWVWDDDGQVIAMVQMPPPPDSGMRTIPRSKALHVRFRYRLDNPEGISVLRVAYTSYHRHKTFSFVESVGIERDLAGYPVVEVPPELLESEAVEDQATVDSFKDLARKIKRDEYEGVVIPAETGMDGNPTGFRLRLLNSGGRRPADVDPVLKRLDSRIAMTLLSEFLLLGQDKVGSNAMHSDKTSLFAAALGAVLDERDRQLNEEVFPELMRLNGWPVELAPKCKHGGAEQVDLQVLGSFLSAVTSSGVVTVDDPLEDWTRKTGGLPPRDTSTARLPPPGTQMDLPLEQEL